MHGHGAKLSRVYRWIQTDRYHCPCLPNGARLRLQGLHCQVWRSSSPWTAGARKGLFCADFSELSDGARIICPRGKERAQIV
eukprot:2016113-Prymnesium_polylepis.1